MEQRQLGSSGLIISSLGLGTRTWGLDTDPHECAEMLKVFLDSGGNFVEVAADPHFPQASEVLGALFSSGLSRQSIRLCLRSGCFTSENSQTAIGPTRDQLLSSLHANLRQLDTDYLDLWLINGPRSGVPLDECLSVMAHAYTQGLARHVGLCGFSTWDGGAAVTTAQMNSWKLDAWADEFSLLRPTLLASQIANEEQSPWKQAGLGVIAGFPLAGGILTGKYRHTLPPDSRAASPRFREEINRNSYKQSTAIVEATTRAAEGLDRSAAQISLAWARDNGGVTSAIVGPRTSRQLEHLLEICDWRIPTAVGNVLTEVAASHSPS